MGRLRGQHDDGFVATIAQARMPRDIGLRIYTYAYAARLREALQNDHPVLGIYLGDALWDILCNGYIAAHPSRHRSLRDFGSDLPQYLMHADSFCGHPEIAELALFERRLLDSFDAADDARAEWGQLMALPESGWPALQLHFHPSLRLHQVARNSVEIWRALKDSQPPPAPAVVSAHDWALWRDEDRVGRFRSLDPIESAALRECMEGGSFASLCERLATTHPAEAVPAMALGHLHAWCTEGWISRWE